MKLDNLQNLVFVHTNDEVKAFLAVFTPLIKAACANAGLPRIDHGVVIDNTAIKFATGRINYNPACGKEGTYVYRVAFNEAVDYYREFFKRTAGREDEAKEALPPTPTRTRPKAQGSTRRLRSRRPSAASTPASATAARRRLRSSCAMSSLGSGARTCPGSTGGPPTTSPLSRRASFRNCRGTSVR